MKIGLVSLVEDQYWQSCYIITNGLRAAYLAFSSGHEIHDWRVSRTKSLEGINKIALDIAAAKVDLVVFIDTSPLYAVILNNLATCDQKPKLRFHVYGDFTMRAYIWQSWEKDLKFFDAEWVCASHRQQKMISTLTNDDGEKNWVCPFPVSKAGFKFDPLARNKIRRKLGFKPTDFVIYYAGRLALQKNVLAVLQVLPNLDSDLQRRVQLVFAGDFDDRGAPFHGTSLLEGEMYCLWQKEVDQLPASLQKRVHLLGGVDHDALQATYSAADCFLSLSLQHDEDFGMAPAEAALSGLPMVLTNWGGYADFKKMGARTELIDVTLCERGPRFDLSDVGSALEKIAAQKVSATLRQKSGRSVSNQLSIKAVTKLLETKTPRQLTPKLLFKNFSPLLKDLSNFFDEARQHLVYPDCEKGSTYEKIYQHYI